ncbi:MAG: DUF1592 domain-containing protein [Planctomycetota bacterium]
MSRFTGRFVVAACVMFCADLCSANETPISRFLNVYCIDCHHADDANGDRAFDAIDFASSDSDTLIVLQDVIDQLTLGDMPPEDAVQPSGAERKKAIKEITELVAGLRARSTSTGGQTVLRRLTRREYLATIGDLFDMDMQMFKPTERFPSEKTSEHLDNVGDALVTSGYLLDQYLDAADEIVEKALADLEPPKELSWNFSGDFDQQPELRIAHRKAFNFRYMCLYDSPLADKPEGAYGVLHGIEKGVPHDGLYEIRVRCQALHRNTVYPAEELRIDLEQPFRLGIRPGRHTVGSLHNLQPTQPLLAQETIKDDELHWYTFRVHLDRGSTPRLTFENGMEGIRPLYGKLVRKYRDTLPEPNKNLSGIVDRRNALLKHGPIPQIRVHEIKVRGPLFDEWPSKTVASVLPNGTFDSNQTNSLVRRFADRAYRRPVTETEIDRLMTVYETRIAHGRSPLGAYKDTLKTILCSPSFLYLQPDCRPKSDQISQHALASRLAYFLTGSMPDKELRRLADAGQLDQEGLLDQTRRLLREPGSDAMVAGLTDAWLNLRSLGEMPPDRGEFWPYYAWNLRDDMRRETRAFFRHLIDENLPATRWLSADYSFINRDLANLYGVADQVSPENADTMRQVSFRDGRRGGLLGQASVLTVSANGIETSPVVRGVWMLENVLGTPPPPPPDDVPAIDPDVRGAKSIRDLLQKHRNVDACNECHRKIDPLGFALESFDPIGRSRSRYRNRVPIDTAGKLPSGQRFEDVEGLKALLLERKRFFVKSFVEKTLAYALGRRIEASDRGTIEAILDKTVGEDFPTRILIEAIVVSDLFRRR